MSEPIQSIANNNYVLHNIDAKKLYVQEPLFTANSGDAVYVGWRPDETVLWSGDANTNITASESLTGFNRIRIKYSTNTNTSLVYGSVHEYKEIDPSTLDHDFTIGAITNNGSNSTNNMLFINTEFSATSNYTVLNMVHTYQVYNNAGTWTTGTNNSIRIKEIVGIGRKENA